MQVVNNQNPENRFMSAFRAPTVDEILGDIAHSSKRVAISAECLTDSLDMTTHRTMMGIHEVGQDNNKEVKALHKKMDKVLEWQRWIQELLHARIGQHAVPPPPDGTRFSMIPFTCPRNFSQSAAFYDFPFMQPLTPNALLDLLAIHPSAHLQDHHYILTRASRIDSATLARAMSLFARRELEQWLHTPQAAVLLVEGCEDRLIQNGKVAAISYVCAKLAGVLGENTAATALTFFCGLHNAPEDPLCGPSGLVRSLLAQLILALVGRGRVSESAALTGKEDEGLGSVGGMCQLFRRLLGAVKGVVYVLVDGISCFDHREKWHDDLFAVMECFQQAVRDETSASQVVVKVLFTNPGAGSLEGWGLVGDQRLRLRSGRCAF